MNKKAGLPAVFFTVLVDLLGFGIVLPLLPYYASRFHASAVAVGLLYSVYSFSQLIFSPIWGGWSDRIGRRPVMLISTLGSTLSYFVFSFSGTLGLLFFSRILAGIMGGNIAAAQAYVADVTKPEERAKGMGVLGAAFGIGFALGPAISSALVLPDIHEAIIRVSPAFLSDFLSANPYALPGLAASLLSLCSFFLVVFWLPESADKNRVEDATRIKRISVFSGQFWSSAFSKEGGQLGRLYLCLLILMIGNSSLYSSFPLFCKQVMRMDAHQVGMQFLMLGAVTIFIQGGMIRVLVKKLGEKKLLIAGNILMMLGFILIGTASSIGWITASAAILALGASLNGPTLNSLISKEAKADNVGLAMGNAQGISALGRVMGPLWGGWLFGVRPQLPFFMTGAMLTLAVWIACSEKVNA